MIKQIAIAAGPALAVACGLWLAVIAGRLIVDRRRRREWDEKNAAWRAAFEAENPDHPPFDEAEIGALADWVKAQALPAIRLVADPNAAVQPGGSRVGGPLWLAPGEAWPTDSAARPLDFVAQLDFSTLPPIPDYPHTGVLRFFAGRDDFLGADFDAPENGQARVEWLPDGVPREAEPKLPPPVDMDRECSALDDTVAATGVALSGTAFNMAMPRWNWQVVERLVGSLGRPGIDRVEAMLDAVDADDAQLAHHVGGHPVYTQQDFRQDVRYRGYDRVLLRLTSENGLMWGDVGEAVFMIARNDLVARRFDRVVFYWDCT